MTPFEDYQPDEDDIMWARRILNTVKDGGILVFPTTKLIYLINHREKTLLLENPHILADEFSASVHRRSIKVFRLIGYMVLVRERDIGEET